MTTLYNDAAGTLPISIVDTGNIIDDGNSSSTNLAAGQTFPGAQAPDLNFLAVQYFLKADQNCIVYVDQSPDGVNWYLTDTFDYYASKGGDGNTIGLVGSYYRVRVTNIGPVATTVFVLQTIRTPIQFPFPRSLTPDGNFKIAIQEGITDESGFSSHNTPHGELLAVPVYVLVGGAFNANTLDSNFWTQSLGTGGSVAVVNNITTISTGTTANNAVSLQSTKNARYTGGQANKYIGLLRLSDGGATLNNTREWGAGDSLSGAFFQVMNGVFNLVTRIGGVDTKVASGGFTGEYGSTLSLGTSYRKYEIVYNPTSVWFYVDDNLIHTMSFPTGTWSSSYHLPVRFYNINTGGSTTNVAMESRGGLIVKLGIPQTQPTSYFQQGVTAGVVLKYGPGNLHGIVLSGITNNSVVTFYDNTAASGTVIWTSGPLTSNGLPFQIDLKGIPFSIGLTIVISGAALNVLTMYE